jgi:uncharacterized protein YjbI with pentapeptide repeats
MADRPSAADPALGPDDRTTTRHTTEGISWGTRAAVIAAVATLIASIGALYFNAQTSRQATTQSRQAQVALTSERFSRSVEQLSGDDLSARMGGVYSFERLIRDSPPDEDAIVDILTSFVRLKTQEFAQDGAGGVFIRDVPDDVAAALQVLAGQPVDLSGADLRGLVLNGYDLHGWDLTGALLTNASLEDADLRATKLKGARMKDVQAAGADLSDADLTEATLDWAVLSGGDLSDANLENATAVKSVMSDASLTGANLHSANLQFVVLTRADLGGADARGVDLLHARLREAQLTELTCSATTKLPPRMDEAEHCEPES